MAHPVGPYLKFIISRVANSVKGWTLRPVETRPERPRAGVGFLAGAASPSPSTRRSGERCKLLQRCPGPTHGKFVFWTILGPQKSRQNGQLAFESGRVVGKLATSESRGQVPSCPNVELSLRVCGKSGPTTNLNLASKKFYIE